MLQVLQNLKSGETTLVEAPAPNAINGQVSIQTRASLISAGTEKMLVEFGQASLLGKAKAQPDKVKQVLDKIKTDGLVPTLEAVFNRLDEPLPLGYCNAGVVIDSRQMAVGSGQKAEDSGQLAVGNGQKAVGSRQLAVGSDHFVVGSRQYSIGDRVVSNGPHAEIVSVPYNLCARIPDNVTDEQAAFTVLASIGLQGMRLAEPTLGEKFVVYGLGLIGLITVQLLRANGCEVMGIDINPARLALAEKYGARAVNARHTDPVTAAMSWSNGKGVDAVLITASAKTDEIVHLSTGMCRKRGRIVLVGVVGLNLRRTDFYVKELSFQVSCSYGPGRYDDKYEQSGQDYPYGFVRWTEQRNFEAILQLLSSGKLVVDDLITHRIPFAEAPRAYDLISKDPGALGVILQYPNEVDASPTISLPSGGRASQSGKAVIGLIGAGNFSKMTLMPALAKTNARLAYISDLKGDAAVHLAKKFAFNQATTDYTTILNDPEVNAVIIATGHASHAELVCESLNAGKHVFVEKPLAMDVDELAGIVECLEGTQAAISSPSSVIRRRSSDLRGLSSVVRGQNKEGRGQRSDGATLMVGYNRRFSPHVQKIKSLLQGRSEPLAMTMTVNAGIIPANHWVHDPVRGGGRIIGEACHFIDLMVYLTDSTIFAVAAAQMGAGVAVHEDKMSITLSFADGSVGTINYFANGSKAYPKETLEVFSEGRVVRLDNFRATTAVGFKGLRRFKTRRQDKGHAAEFAAFVNLVEAGGEPLIPLHELINVSLASFAAMTSAAEKRYVVLDEEYGKIV